MLCCKNNKIEVTIELRKDHPFFQRLKNNPPLWWNNLKSDTELYIDVRKDNSLNVYHNGGSIMKLESIKKSKETIEFKAQIHFEYIPLQLDKESDYLPFKFKGENIYMPEHKTIDINNFAKQSIKKIKKRIKMFYPNDSEKGIQGRYVINNKISKSANGFFIDTEYQYGDKRIDMVWVDLIEKKIAFVELKTIGDARLYVDKTKNQETVENQLEKYYKFARANRDHLVKYYNEVYDIKRELGILPAFVKEESLKGYKLIEKPIFLVGDCTRKWINKNADDLNSHLKNIAFGCVYHGIKTLNFKIPYKTSRNNNCFRLNGA